MNWMNLIGKGTMKNAKAWGFSKKETSEILLTEKEGNLRGRRLHRPLDLVRIICLDLCLMQGAYQSTTAQAKLHGSNGRAPYSIESGWHPYVGQRSTRARNL
jgi:hypothetical protein